MISRRFGLGYWVRVHELCTVDLKFTIQFAKKLKFFLSYLTTHPAGVYAHWGEFVMLNWQFNDMISAEVYADEAQKWVDAGVKLLGAVVGLARPIFRN